MNSNDDLQRYLDEAFASHGKWRALIASSPASALNQLLAMRAAKQSTDESPPPPPQPSATLLSASLQKNELR